MKKSKKHYLFEMELIPLNVIATVIFFAGIILFILLLNLSDLKISFDFNTDYKYLMILLVPYFALHEILHFIGYYLNGADASKLTFGVHLEKGVFCCSCKQIVNKKCIMWSLIYPFLFIGVITCILGFIINSSVLILLSIANISGAAGDLIMFFNFLKIKDFEFAEYDNPIGFSLYSSEDLSKRKMFGLKFIETRDELECHVTKKLTVSKKSIYYLIGWALLCFAYCVI